MSPICFPVPIHTIWEDRLNMYSLTDLLTIVSRIDSPVSLAVSAVTLAVDTSPVSMLRKVWHGLNGLLSLRKDSNDCMSS